MSAVRTRTLVRPAAQKLYLSLDEDPSLQFRTFFASEDHDSDDTPLTSAHSHASPNSALSAVLWSAGVPFSALSSCSVYSQDSWNSQRVIFDLPPELRTPRIRPDTRRFAIALRTPEIDALAPLASSSSSGSSNEASIINLQITDGEFSLLGADTTGAVVEPNAVQDVVSAFDFSVEAGPGVVVDIPETLVEASPLALTSEHTAPATAAKNMIARGPPSLPLLAKGLRRLLPRIPLPDASSKRRQVSKSMIRSLNSSIMVSDIQRELREEKPLKAPHHISSGAAPSAHHREHVSQYRPFMNRYSTAECPVKLPAVTISPLSLSFGNSISEDGTYTSIMPGGEDFVGIAI